MYVHIEALFVNNSNKFKINCLNITTNKCRINFIQMHRIKFDIYCLLYFIFAKNIKKYRKTHKTVE